MDPMEAIRQTFFCECDEQLAELEAGLLSLNAGEHDAETVNAVFRAVHSVKGGAGAFGLDRLVRFAHVFETALDALRSGQLSPEPPVLKPLLRAADLLADLVRAERGGAAADEAQVAASIAELAALQPGLPLPSDAAADFELSFLPISAGGAPIPPPQTEWIVRFKPHAAMYAKANDAALLLRELACLGTASVRVDASDLPGLAELEPEGAYLAWTVSLRTEQPAEAIREVFEFVEGDCDFDLAAPTAPAPVPSDEPDIEALLRGLAAEAPAVPGTQPPPPREEAAPAAKVTIRVDLDRVDRLIDLVGELVINGAMLAEGVVSAGLGTSSAAGVALAGLEALTREIQDSVMAIRAQPVKSVFARMPRLVRDVAAMTGKQVRLVCDGESTEVDKTVIEHLADPLTHMIRNAIDHGLESPEERRRAGKPAEGTVRLAALHRSGRIVIEVSDDGAGIDRARVRSSAVAKGLIPEGATLSDEETDNLIFMPGFSTAAALSDISGRGVGMDIVRRSVQGLGGRIAIASRPGLGSAFTMSLPLTLAVLDGMVVTVAGQTLIVPLTAILETLQPAAKDVHPLGEQGAVVAIRGVYLPLLSVAALLGWDAPDWSAGSVALLVEGDGGRRAALIVDAIQGQQQVVIKSLEANYRPVAGVAAATIMGNGRVALILDVDAIIAGACTEPDCLPVPPVLGEAYA